MPCVATASPFVARIAELHDSVSQLPGALASDVPDLMIDYLATVFTEDDAQPVSRYICYTAPMPLVFIARTTWCACS